MIYFFAPFLILGAIALLVTWPWVFLALALFFIVPMCIMFIISTENSVLMMLMTAVMVGLLAWVSPWLAAFAIFIFFCIWVGVGAPA